MNKKLILCILTILWICFIFSFSLHSGEKSAQLSDSVGESILEHSSSSYFDDVDEWSSLELESFHKVIRKCAHFTEFFILGILMRLTWQQTEMRYKRVMSVGLCFLVAVLDETIQLFVSGSRCQRKHNNRDNKTARFSCRLNQLLFFCFFDAITSS